MSAADDAAHRVPALVEQIKPILKGEPAEVQSAVLADLLAMWLAGHFIPGDPAATAHMRAELLNNHMRLAVDMIRPTEQAMGIHHLMDVQGGRQ